MIVPDVNLPIYAYREDDLNHEIERLGHHVDGQTDQEMKMIEYHGR